MAIWYMNPKVCTGISFDLLRGIYEREGLFSLGVVNYCCTTISGTGMSDQLKHTTRFNFQIQNVSCNGGFRASATVFLSTDTIK